MAAQTAAAANGDRFILGADRRWRKATPDEQDILTASGTELALESGLSTLAGFAQLGGAALLGSGRGGGQTPIGRELATAGMANLERVSDITNVRPVAGSFGADAALEVATLGAAKLAKPLLAARQARRQAAQASARAAPSAAPALTSTNSEVIQTVGDLTQQFGADSVGAAARGGFWDSLKRMPGLSQFLEGLEDMIGTARPLTGGQRAMLAVGDDGINAVQRTGFELLPGQANGNNILSEIILRDPLMADAFDSVLTANSDELMRRISRALGVEPGHHGRDFRQLGRESVGEMFETVQAQLPEITLPADIVETISSTLTPRQRNLLDLEGSLGGADIKEIREALAGELASITQREGAGGVTARTLREAADLFDETIESAIDDPAVLNLWREARQRWRVVRAFDRQGVITQDGDVSIKTLVNALEREFPVEFRRSNLAANVSGLPQDIVELMDFARVGRTFMSNLGNSGTGTTSSLINDLTNPLNAVKKRAAARFISDVLLNRPDIADTLPGVGAAQ